MEEWWLFFAVGLVAQLIDGALGMAFGVTATTFMLSLGVSPAQASAMVHIAEIFTTAASGASHVAHRNVDWTIVRRIAVPGKILGILGATVLSNIDGKAIAPLHATFPAGRLQPSAAIDGQITFITPRRTRARAQLWLEFSERGVDKPVRIDIGTAVKRSPSAGPAPTSDDTDHAHNNHPPPP